MSTTPRALDLRPVVQRIEEASGVRSGFPTPDDHNRFHHAVELDGLARAKIGHTRFCAAYQIALRTAVALAPLAFLVQPIRDARRVVSGYEFAFEHADTAAEFVELVMPALRRMGLS